MKRLRLAWITNIPAPYRLHSFERMAAILPEHGIDPEVHFMAWTEPRRPWRFTAADFRFTAHVHRGIHPHVRGISLHFNPGLLFSLARADIDLAMVGGYSSPSHALLPFFLRRPVRILGCESNTDSVGRRYALAARVKRTIVSRYDAFLVPQARSLEYLTSLDPGVRGKPHVVLPNLVKETVFRDAVLAARRNRDALRAQRGIRADETVWLCPARLSPEKGLEPFLDALDGTQGVRLLVAGDGPLRARLEARIAALRTPVALLGQMSEEQMVELYALSDLFVLPSCQDPSPLATIEACAASLPLLISSRVGTVDDVLTCDNGWSFDIDSPQDTRQAITRSAGTSPNQLAVMGIRSGEVHARHFDTDECTRRLAVGLREIWRNVLASRGDARSP